MAGRESDRGRPGAFVYPVDVQIKDRTLQDNPLI